MRVAVLNYDYCKPDKCNLECINFCPINRSGGKAIELSDVVKGKPVIYEDVCIGCGICVRKCPFEAIDIVNLPDEFEGEVIHRYTINGFKLFGLPILKQGLVTGIIGKNGSGKSTILKILSGSLLPNFGDPNYKPKEDEVLIRFKGKEIYDYLKKLYDKKLRVVFKTQYIEYLLRYLKGTVKENLMKIDERGKLDEIISELNIENYKNNDVQVLSGGELQTFLVAAALLKEADVYLFDEPASYLDIRQRVNVSKAIRDFTKNKYVAVVEHDLIVLDYLADNVNIVFGESGVYGKVSKTYSSKTGINHYLHGYLPAENMRIRSDEIKFNLRELSELDFTKGIKDKVSWTDIKKVLGEFRLFISGGSCREGEIIGILGPNGIGKTTFARILVGEISPDEGAVFQQGLTLAYKPQKIVPDYDGTVSQYLESVSKDILSTSNWFFVEVVKRLSLHRLLEHNVKELSGGELQKLYIAATLAKNADIYVFDEPSSYLDVEERYIVAKAIKRVTRERKAATFVIEHDLAFHDYIDDRVIVFEGIPAVNGIASPPTFLKDGMNIFLKKVNLTLRRDGETGRPRINKPGSYLDRLQKEKGEFYSISIINE